MKEKRGWTIRELIKELGKVPEQDKDKMIWQKLDFYMGSILSISKDESGDYIFSEFKGADNDNLNYINKFLEKAKEKYPNIIFKYRYEDGCYTVIHNYEDELDDKEWKEYFGKLMNDIFFQNDIYNFSFYWDYDLN